MYPKPDNVVFYSSPDNYGETIYCIEKNISDVEESLADPGVFGPDFTPEEWEPWEWLGDDVHRDLSGNYARFRECRSEPGYYERVSDFTQWDPRDD